MEKVEYERFPQARPMPSNLKTPGSFLNKFRIVAGENFHIAANSLGL